VVGDCAGLAAPAVPTLRLPTNAMAARPTSHRTWFLADGWPELVEGLDLPQ
jgi:hypothetical protein